MRLRQLKVFIFIIILLNLILLYYTWKEFIWKTVLNNKTINSNILINDNTNKLKVINNNKHIRKSITIIFRQIYNFENDLKSSLDSMLNVIPNIQIIIINDQEPYPPLIYENNLTNYNNLNNKNNNNLDNVKFINLNFNIMKTIKETPLTLIKTKYVLFMPDSVRLNNKNLLQKILKDVNSNWYKNQGNQLNVKIDKKNKIMNSNNDVGNLVLNNNNSNNTNNNNTKNKLEKKMIIIPFIGNLKTFNSCTKVKLNFANWTIEYIAVNNTENCDLYLQKHAILIDVDILREMPDPLLTPFPEMFYIQAKIFGIQKKIFPLSFQDGRRLFISYHTKQRRMEIRRKQFREMYKKLQIKRIIKRSHKISTKSDPKDTSNPTHNLILESQFSSSNFSFPLQTEIHLIGCERTTKSCIGQVHNQKPFYMYLNKHTPPCCLDKLKTVFHHVMEEFENVGIRYWLDNYALKTAIETNQLSPDAYEIDISFIAFDLERSPSLKKSQTKPFTDSEGFYWIKATDGQYFHVQFSKINQISINLLPFEINGNKVKPYGFFGWKAKEFSSEFLHPMSTVRFLNKNIMCPNNVREFLDFKNIK